MRPASPLAYHMPRAFLRVFDWGNVDEVSAEGCGVWREDVPSLLGKEYVEGVGTLIQQLRNTNM